MPKEVLKNEMNATDVLEKRIYEFITRSETKKTWNEWLQWLQAQGIKISNPVTDPYPEKSLINYQTFLGWYDEALNQHPELLHFLTSPDWLISRKVNVLPGKNNGDPNFQGFQKQIDQLNREMQNLQQRLLVLEQNSGGIASLRSDKSSYFSGDTPVTSMNESFIPKEKADILDKELLIRKLSEKPKPVSKEENKPKQPENQRLEELYLSFNDWCDQFQTRGIDLQEFASKPIRVSGSHQISFKQFGFRVERKIEKIAEFRKVFHEFESKYANGLDIIQSLENKPGIQAKDLSIKKDNSSEPDLSEVNSQKETAFIPEGFVPPFKDEYKSFGDWIKWLQEHNIDPYKFTKKDLKVQSSHQISFPQFCRRLERQLEDVEGFRRLVNY